MHPDTRTAREKLIDWNLTFPSPRECQSEAYLALKAKADAETAALQSANDAAPARAEAA